MDEGSVFYADGGLHAMSGISLRNLRETHLCAEYLWRNCTFCSLVFNCISLIIVVASFTKKNPMPDT